MEPLNTKLLFESAEEFWNDNSGRLAMAARAVTPIGQTLINGRHFELQVVMTSRVEEMQFSTPDLNEALHPTPTETKDK